MEDIDLILNLDKRNVDYHINCVITGNVDIRMHLILLSGKGENAL